MKPEPMEVNAALERGLALPYALVRSLSRVTLGPTPETVELDELLEARFFSAGEEIRIFRGDRGLQAARLTPGETELDEERRELANPRFFGRAVTVRSALGFDGDGQAYIAYTRLTGWEGGNEYAQ